MHTYICVYIYIHTYHNHNVQKKKCHTAPIADPRAFEHNVSVLSEVMSQTTKPQNEIPL